MSEAHPANTPPAKTSTTLTKSFVQNSDDPGCAGSTSTGTFFRRRYGVANTARNRNKTTGSLGGIGDYTFVSFLGGIQPRLTLTLSQDKVANFESRKST